MMYYKNMDLKGFQVKTTSVQIVTFNSEKDIQACLDAVFHQDYPIEQIIVVDNNSADATLDILKTYRDQITLVENTTNLGFAQGHNQAIKLSQSDYCLVLNPDVTLNPDYLSILMCFLDENEDTEIGSLTGKLLRKDNPMLVDSCGIMMNKVRRAFDLGSGESSDYWIKEKYVFGVSGAAALYSRKMIDQISYNGQFFDNLFFAYKEDVDVAWRAKLFGWKAACVPQAIGLHGRGWKKGKRHEQPLFVRKLSYVNRYKMIIKNDSRTSILRSIIPLLFYECLSFTYVVTREPRLLSTWITIVQQWKEINSWKNFIRHSVKQHPNLPTVDNH